MQDFWRDEILSLISLFLKVLPTSITRPRKADRVVRLSASSKDFVESTQKAISFLRQR
jgi:hypothetical protein